MAYNYDKFDKSITEFVKENNIQSSTDYLLITSLKDKFTYVYEYKNGWELEYKWSSTVGKSSTPTIKGVFSVGIKYPAIGGNTSSVKYATNIVDDYYYHSIIYLSLIHIYSFLAKIVVIFLLFRIIFSYKLTPPITNLNQLSSK